MTSLSKQLETLRTATARQLTVEKKHISLLFDKQEAQKLDRETCYKIGCTGFEQLKKLDANIYDDCSEFFNEEKLNFQRTMISKDENETWNKNLERFIIKLAPYFMHFSCQQVLEWLIYKFQIYSYNAELLITAFLPYHDTNIFARLLSIIEFDFASSKDWAFLGEFAKKKIPVPFRILVKNALSSNHSMLSRISDHIEKSVEAVGAEFIETRSHLIFTFYAKLIVSALDSPKALDENLISKIVPIVGNGLRSSIPSFRNSSMMIICQLCNAVKLSDPILSSITKILIIKMQSNTLITSLSTLIVICQLQNISSFSKKATLKLLRKTEQLGFWAALETLAEQTDLFAFYTAFWSTLFSILHDEETSTEIQQQTIFAIQKTIKPERLSKEQASAFLAQLISSLSLGLSLSPAQSDIYNICLRFPEELDALITEWTSREEAVAIKFLKEYKLEQLKAVPVLTKKRQRRRSSSQRQSISEQIEEKKNPLERARIMAGDSEFTKRQTFKGDPIKKAEQWIESSDINNLTWALEEISLRRSYFANQLEEEVEEFIIRLLKFSLNNKYVTIDKIKSALTHATFRSDFIVSLLSRHEEQGSSAKKVKGKNKLTVENEFTDEDDAKYWKRATYVIEILSVADKLQLDSKTFKLMFDLLKEAEGIQDGQIQHSVQHSIINLLTKMITTPGNYKATIKDLHMDSVVETMRSTQSHHILRDSLKLLTAAVQLNPSSIASHIMSVFTFMGSGLLRKDNDLTLGIIEKTLEALFAAVVHKSHVSKLETAQKLIAVSRVFAASAPDIPAHRRPRMAKAISTAVGFESIWIVAAVMIEGFCTKWQRTDPNKNSSEQDAFEDIAQELCTNLNATDQLRFVLDIIQFVVRLGGDAASESKKQDPIDAGIFDRSKFTVQKLRHFRFILIGVVVKILGNRTLLEKLARCTDDELYNTMVPIGKRLLINSVELDEFGKREEKIAEASGEAQTLRYWVALQARCDLVSEKLRYLLPGGVAARLTTDVLEDDKTESRMREKVLQLANVKLLTDGFFYSDSGINENHLTRLAYVLNKWIVPIRSDSCKIELCKNATFSLRLVAKRIPKQSESDALTDTMNKTIDLIKQWHSLDETMVGNALLLAGELIRSHNMRCTMLSCEPLLAECFSIINEFLSSSHQNKGEEELQTKRQRVRQQSLSGRKLGSDTLLIASLTCLQRILDQFSAFISNHIGDVIVRFCRLAGKYPAPDSVPAKGTLQHRMLLIRIALSKLEFRILPNHFAFAVKEVVAEEKSLCALMNLISSHLTQNNRAIISSNKMVLTENIFIPAFNFRNLQRKPENFENVANLEQYIFNTMLKMCDTLTETELRSVVTTVVQWAELGLEHEASRDMRIRLISLFHFANEFFSYFNQLAMPYFGKLLEIAPKILLSCNTSYTSESANLLLSGKRDTIEGLETDFLLRQIIIFIGNCGRHKEFISKDRVDVIVQALVEELTNTRVAGHEARCVPYLAEAFYRMCDVSPENVPDFLNKIMLKTRNNRAKVRFRTLLVLEALLNRIGDGIAPHLPVIMPFLSELLEDENKNVEEQTDKVIRTLQRKFGENISDGFA